MKGGRLKLRLAGGVTFGEGATAFGPTQVAAIIELLPIVKGREDAIPGFADYLTREAMYGSFNQHWPAPENKTASGRGAPRKLQAERIAWACATVWARLCGSDPTVTVRLPENKTVGPFVDFLQAIFSGLSVEASAPSVADAICTAWRQKRKARGEPPVRRKGRRGANGD